MMLLMIFSNSFQCEWYIIKSFFSILKILSCAIVRHGYQINRFASYPFLSAMMSDAADTLDIYAPTLGV